jgi:dolichol-phosphate mannosyltransferase
LCITEKGWGMPLQLWVQAARAGLRVKEVAVPRLYLDPNRAFGGVMNDAEQRLAYYRKVITEAEAELDARQGPLPGIMAACCPDGLAGCGS